MCKTFSTLSFILELQLLYIKKMESIDTQHFPLKLFRDNICYYSSTAACAAANLAIGTRNGEHEA